MNPEFGLDLGVTRGEEGQLESWSQVTDLTLLGHHQRSEPKKINEL